MCKTQWVKLSSKAKGVGDDARAVSRRGLKETRFSRMGVDPDLSTRSNRWLVGT